MSADRAALPAPGEPLLAPGSVAVITGAARGIGAATAHCWLPTAPGWGFATAAATN